ncbi:hypothetical protein KO317_02365 [Candidatus Micrarchaeota archaeon]|nr:hypothetical protein [Candidatus Micrarchaeota archaeon]
MKKNLLFIFILFSLFFGCLTNLNGDTIDKDLANETDHINISETNNSNINDEFDLEPNLVINISTDKLEYKSSQQVNISINIESNMDFKNASLSIRAINNRFKEDRTIDLTIGNNSEKYLFKLPKCNVCGGIKEGDYTITANIVLNNITFSNLTIINVKQ